MINKLKPHMYEEDIYAIDYKVLKNQGIRGIIFDIDNTLIPYEEDVPRDIMINLFDELKEMGFKIALVSNGPKKRVERFNSYLRLPAVHRAFKPFKYTLRKIISKMNLRKYEVAIVGDQIFTDILAGNGLGIKTILVKPIRPKKNIVEKLKRKAESGLLRIFNK